MNTFEMNNEFIIAAYSVMWVVVLGYLVRLIRKGSRARTDYDVMVRDNGGERP
ncbi:MAG TPA: CcmD family protein [Gemmatimonadaceae bacterium]|nr:CcmD family protein [Gemmatimonadaceae bacterium]